MRIVARIVGRLLIWIGAVPIFVGMVSVVIGDALESFGSEA